MDENEKKGGLVGFFTANSSAITKLIVYHIAMCIFGLVVSIALEMVAAQIDGGTQLCKECGVFYEIGDLGKDLLCLKCGQATTTKLSAATYIAGGFGALLYLGLIYIAMWEKGASDKLKIDGGRQVKSKVKGLLIWLIANSALIVILHIIALLSFIPALSDIHRISAIVGLYTNAMYYPFLWLFSYYNITELYVIVLIPGAVVATLSYISGVRGDRCIFPEPRKERNRQTR